MREPQAAAILWRPYPEDPPQRALVGEVEEYLVSLRDGTIRRWHYSQDLWGGLVLAWARDPQPYSPVTSIDHSGGPS